MAHNLITIALRGVSDRVASLRWYDRRSSNAISWVAAADTIAVGGDRE